MNTLPFVRTLSRPGVRLGRTKPDAMRIGLVIDQFNPHRGGAERWTADFAEQLLVRGHEVHVVACDFAPAAFQLPIVAHALGRVRSRLRFASAAEECLRALDLDVIHDMGSGWYCDLFMSHDGSRIAQWEHKLRILPSWLRPAKRMMIRWLPRYREFRTLFGRQLADPGPLILALSKAIAGDYQRLHGVQASRIRLVYNGVDTGKFSPEHRADYRDEFRRKLGLSEQETAFLFVGHDGARKGLPTAIRALGRLHREGYPVKLVVVGGRRLGPYVRLARQCHAQDVVHFAGKVEEPVPYYAAADVFVLPTFYDPCSLSVLEAMASGLPSITTRCNGAGEMLTEGVQGLILSDPADECELAGLMRTLLDPARRAGMGSAARELALQCTFERNCDQMLEIYREIVAAKSKPEVIRLAEHRQARAA